MTPKPASLLCAFSQSPSNWQQGHNESESVVSALSYKGLYIFSLYEPNLTFLIHIHANLLNMMSWQAPGHPAYMMQTPQPDLQLEQLGCRSSSLLLSGSSAATLKAYGLFPKHSFNFAAFLRLCAESIHLPPVDLQLAWALKGKGAQG